MRHRILASPVGPLTLVVDDDGALTGLYTDQQRYFPPPAALGEPDDTAAPEVVEQLQEYFAGVRTEFDLTLAPRSYVAVRFPRIIATTLPGTPPLIPVELRRWGRTEVSVEFFDWLVGLDGLRLARSFLALEALD